MESRSFSLIDTAAYSAKHKRISCVFAFLTEEMAIQFAVLDSLIHIPSLTIGAGGKSTVVADVELAVARLCTTPDWSLDGRCAASGLPVVCPPAPTAGSVFINISHVLHSVIAVQHPLRKDGSMLITTPIKLEKIVRD